MGCLIFKCSWCKMIPTIYSFRWNNTEGKFYFSLYWLNIPVAKCFTSISDGNLSSDWKNWENKIQLLHWCKWSLLIENRNEPYSYNWFVKKVKKSFIRFLIQEKILNLKLNLSDFLWRRKKIIYVCYIFLSTRLSLSETIDNYIKRLYPLTKSSEYKRFEDKVSRYHIVISCVLFYL